MEYLYLWKITNQPINQSKLKTWVKITKKTYFETCIFTLKWTEMGGELFVNCSPTMTKWWEDWEIMPSILQQSHLIFTTRCKFSHFFLRDLCVDFSVYFCICLLLFIILEQIAVCMTLYFLSELHHFNDIPKNTYTLNNCWHNVNFFVITLLMENCAKLQMQSWGSLSLWQTNN